MSASNTTRIQKEKRWLNPGEHNGEHIAIVSYPRSGNSLMRGLLESITGVYTGCDTRPDRSLSLELQKCGMKGEGVVDERVWFVKSHYPERSGYLPVTIKKAILVVRNPWDAINSYFNMTLTNSHNKSLHDSQYERFQERWDGMIKNEIQVWMKFHQYWISKVDIAIQVVRYEDLLVHRKETMHRVFKFILDKDPKESLEGTPWMTQIESILTEEDTGPYKPRSGKIASSFRHYSPEQFKHVLDTGRTLLRNFGYDTESQNFPADIRLPNRQIKPARPDATTWILSGDKLDIRERNDRYGRYSTVYRKMLLEPVIASDGSELNIDEVLAAREREKVEKTKMHEGVEGRPLLGSKTVELREDSSSISSATDMEDLQHAYTPFLGVTVKDPLSSVPMMLNQLGTFNGVYVPCLLNIIGVILFLRLGWAIGQTGVLGMLTIFFFAELQAVLTVLSASTIASNGAMRGGGSYYLISRSLGPECGGAIGVQFYLLYASGVAMYLVGFAEEVEQTWFSHSPWGKKWVVIAVASISLVTITIIALIGAHAFSKVNQYLFVVQFACILYGAIAICVVAPHALISGGEVTGPRSTTLAANMHSNYTSELNVCGSSTVCDFAQVYAIVFPLATGFMEGLNLSGDLKNPGRSIPVGSLAAVLTSCVIYITLIFLFGASFTGVTLRTNFTFFQEVSGTPFVVITGILVSCYTSGLGALFGASRILQAIARDNLFKGTRFLGQGSARGDEPQAAVIFTALLSLVFIFIGDLDVLAPICTSFFCLAYAAVNFTAFILQVTGVPNFRPTFAHNNWLLSLLGVVVNLAVMIYLNPMYAAVTFLVVCTLFGYLYIAGPATSWGNVSQALMYHQVRKYLLRLDTRKGHLKFWRPAILFVPRDDNSATVHLCNQLKKGGLYVVGDLVLGELNSTSMAQSNNRRQRWLDIIRDSKLKAIPQVLVARTIREGYQGLMQCSGLGGMDINTMAFDWMLGEESSTSSDAFVGVLNDALLVGKNIIVFRHCEHLESQLVRLSRSSMKWNLPWGGAPNTTIDVWITNTTPWPVDGQVAGMPHVTLMLQLTHVLHSNYQWKSIPIRLIRVCELEQHEVESERKHLVNVAAELRISLQPTNAILLPIERQRPPFQSPDEIDHLSRINGMIRERSKDATLVIVGLIDPTSYTSKPNELKKRLDVLTHGCPPTMLVWSADEESVITTCI